MAEKKKITAEYAPRYRQAKKAEINLLDEYLRLTGSKSRKYAIFKLNRVGKTQLRSIGGETLNVNVVEKSRKKRVYKPYYDEEVANMLLFLWRTFNWQCRKLFAPFLQQNLDIIRQVEPYAMSDLVAAKLKKISPRTIDRLLKKPKQQMKIHGTSGTKPVRLLHRAIPIVTWFDYAKRSSGFFQIDLVQHDGGNPSGEFCYTLTMTDVKTGWTVHFALRNKAALWVKEALQMARITLPMGLKGIHSDTGSEFINEPVDKWCQAHGVEFTRGRPTHKNDNCYVEQKNYATVRKIIGYARYEGDEGVAALQAVYSAYDPLLNLYYPCMKQISCERVGAKKKRHYDAAKTPFQRLLEQPFQEALEEIRVKQEALKLRGTIPIVAQRDLMDKALDHLLNSAHDVPAIAPRRGAQRHG
ncbi:integrase catalytic domain-containing protein [Treponema primitia]|nr:DDE-type integrase/transposase/recombinase [Treponema primitia]